MFEIESLLKNYKNSLLVSSDKNRNHYKFFKLEKKTFLKILLNFQKRIIFLKLFYILQHKFEKLDNCLFTKKKHGFKNVSSIKHNLNKRIK